MKRGRLRLAALGVAVALLGALTPSMALGATTPFTDIAASPFRSDIEWLYAEGVTKGCTTTKYCPTDPVTREQMASFLVRMFHLTEGGSVNAFTDDESSTHQANINRLAYAGIAKGCTTTTYCPLAKVTRAQMATFLARAIPLSIGAGNNYFNDDNGNTHEANIDKAARAGIASGCAMWKYCPDGTVTREQMAAFLHRVVSPVKQPPYPAPDPDPEPDCDPAYPDVCIPSPPPDLNCPDISYRDFRVLGHPDPHGFDGDGDGIGCET